MIDKNSCQICGKITKRIGMHVERAHNLLSKEYYDTYIKSADEGFCENCGNITTFININQGYCRFCGSSCASTSKTTQAKRHKTCFAEVWY